MWREGKRGEGPWEAARGEERQGKGVGREMGVREGRKLRGVKGRMG